VEETMFDADRRPFGRLFYWLLAVMIVTGCGLMGSGAAAVPQSGVASTTISDTVYMADDCLNASTWAKENSPKSVTSAP
jgi:hypothetical protein